MEFVNRKTGQILVIEQDSDPENPREWDNLGKMVCFHKRYNLGDENDFSPTEFGNWDELETYIYKKMDAAVVLPIYLYDHSGITMSTSPFSCPWDSGQVGFIYATHEGMEKEFGEIPISDAVKIMNETLNGEVELYDLYLRGEVYGYTLFKVQECDLGYEHRISMDSCWGFYGSDPEENGIFDQAEIDITEWEKVG